jgi:ubiquinone/menaquinone biosynthesis C-methylase UbiE
MIGMVLLNTDQIHEEKEGVRDTYERMAHNYDSSEHLYWARRIEEGEERGIGAWIKDLSFPILDVGCGTGRSTIKVAKHGSDIVALDISLKMLKKTLMKAKKDNVVEKIFPILADGEHLPFRDQLFNSLICTLTFDHFLDCDSAVSEFSRVLATNGHCILSTFNSFTLQDFKKRYGLPPDKISFQTEDLPQTLIYEIGHSADEMEELFEKNEFDMVKVKGCCYWHLVPTLLTKYYPAWLDSFFNIFKSLVKYAEIHIVLLKKS